MTREQIKRVKEIICQICAVVGAVRSLDTAEYGYAEEEATLAEQWCPAVKFRKILKALKG